MAAVSSGEGSRRNEVDRCAICLEMTPVKGSWEEYEECGVFEGENPVLPMHDQEHYFHYECARQWIRLESSCPMCRHELTEEEKERFVFQSSLELAIRVRNLEAVQNLIGEEILLQDQIQGLRSAIQTGDFELARILVHRLRMPERDWRMMIWLAVRARKVDIAQLLLSVDPLAPLHRGLAAMYAAEADNVEMLREIVYGGEMLEELWSGVAIAAANRGHREIMQFLLQQPFMTPEKRRHFANVARRGGHIELAREIRGEPNPCCCVIL